MTWIPGVLIAILAILLAGIRVLGFTPLTVLSGSIQPEIPTGSVVYVTKVSPGNVKEGDVISYMLDSETVSTHRVVQILKAAPAAALVTCSVLGTLAYLKATSEVARNTFTIGNVPIILTETDVDGDGDGKYSILALTQAVQTGGFDTAEEAFGDITPANITLWFEAEK